MKKELFKELAMGFLMTSIGLSLFSTPVTIDNTSIGEAKDVLTDEIKQNIIEEADEYLSQIIVQSRYVAALDIVWVYGCADKS